MGTGRKKILMQKIENIRNRRVTYSKRRKSLFKKAKDLSILTGCKVAVLSLSSANNVFFHGDHSLFEASTAQILTNLNSITLNPFSDSVGNFSNEDIDMYEDEFSVEDDDDDESVSDLFADNGGQSHNMNSNDVMMKNVPWIESDSTNQETIYTEKELDDLFAEAESSDHDHNSSVDIVEYNCCTDTLQHCNLSAKSECYFFNEPFLAKDMKIGSFGSVRRRDRAASGEKGKDELMRSSKEEDMKELLLSRKSLEEFKEAMKLEYKLASEAGELIPEDNVFL